jgi:predicted nucleic acid-binding Zn ribbon protein
MTKTRKCPICGRTIDIDESCCDETDLIEDEEL